MAIITIDVSPETESFKLPLPITWSDVADRLGVTEPTVKKCRQALDRVDDPISEDLFEEIRRMVALCSFRQRGGGGSCTRKGYMTLKLQGQEVLEARLKQFQII
jgi:hypothetical protein